MGKLEAILKISEYINDLYTEDVAVSIYDWDENIKHIPGRSFDIHDEVCVYNLLDTNHT